MVLVSAPTGFGKTISVLYSISKIFKRGEFTKAFYTVRTRNELDPVIKECKVLGLNFVVLYSVRRMCPLAKDFQVSNEGFWSICTVLRLRGECKFYTRVNGVASSDILSIVKEFNDHVSIAKGISDKLGVCPYYALLQSMNDVDVISFTYPYVFKESIWSSIFKDFDISQTLLIVDEAHNLLNIGGVMGESTTVGDLRKAAEEALRLSADDVAEVLKNILSLALDKAPDKGYKYLGKERLGIDKTFFDKVLNLSITAIIKAMKNFEYKLNISKLDLAISRIAKFFLSIENVDYDVFISKDANGRITLSSLPISFNPLKIALERFPAIILMSATPPSQEFISRSIKISKQVLSIDVEDLGSKNYLRDNSTSVIFSGATTSYRVRNDIVFNVYRNLIEKLYYVTPKGVVMVVYPSYEVMSSILKNLSIDELVVEGVQALSEIMSLVTSRPKILLNVVAGGKLTEGVEFVFNGESLIKTVIVVGVPYPQPDDYVEKLRLSIVGSGGSYVDYYKDIAVVRVLQAIGRAIRSENDYAFVVLADRRYIDQSIMKRLRLKPRAITRNVDTVVQIAYSYFKQLMDR